MNTRQKLFVEYYLSNRFNATKAAIAAGYSEKTAHSTGPRLLENAEIVKRVKERIRQLLSETETLTLRWVDRVTEIAFSEPNKLHNKHGDYVGLDHSNQLKALDLLAKYLSLYSDIDVKDPQTKETPVDSQKRRERILELNKRLKL